MTHELPGKKYKMNKRDIIDMSNFFKRMLKMQDLILSYIFLMSGMSS